MIATHMYMLSTTYVLIHVEFRNSWIPYTKTINV